MTENVYDHQNIEKKWQEKWFSENMFSASEDSDKHKYYILDMFPYPSGAGLHVGHPEGYTATDIVSRYVRMKRRPDDGKGFNVLHPMGWDAFGLPAENYAIKTKVHPEKSTLDNIQTFKRQIKELGFSYDWEREVATCLPDYYKWTQWWFSFLYKNKLAYKKEAAVNWCEDCHTVLANEQVTNGKCERCKNEVHQKNLSQWFFKITDFIENSEETSGLIDGLEKIDWPESTKIGQLNWIGKSTGVEVAFSVKGSEKDIHIYTTRFDTIFGTNFVAIAPEHPNIMEYVTEEQKEEVEQYIEEVEKKTELERQSEGGSKTGVKTGMYAINPMSGEEIPIFVADFVLMYGTAAVMGTPAHDKRDFQFAKKFGLQAKQVISSNEDEIVVDDLHEWKESFHEYGRLVNSGEWDGMSSVEAIGKMADKMEREGWGKRKVNYKLRDWLVSRQRYWGAPIPMVFDDEDNEYLLPEDELPVTLPNDVDFVPSGESPLKKSKTFHAEDDLKRIEKKLKDSGKMPEERKIVRRESDTMDTFVCSSWYFWRFMDPNNDREMASKDKMKKWGPVDLYIGGAEHTVLHLLYARFFCKVLHKYGYIDYDEPFLKLRHQGMILGEDGEKMSKSRGNVINPDEIIKDYGADTLRLYEMFMGPFDQMKPWSMKGVQGVYRFIQKLWRLGTESNRKEIKPLAETMKIMHQTIKKVSSDIERFKFNTAISQMMIYLNHLQKLEEIPQSAYEILLICLYPYAPHICEELWQQSGHPDMIMDQEWPVYDEELAKEEMINLPVQVNGKLRGSIDISADISKEEAIKLAKEDENVKRHIEGKEIVKEIFVKNKIVNFVVKI